MSKKSSVLYSLLLVLAALIWGSAFVAQSTGMDTMGPFTFLSIRFILGALVLLPVIFFMDKKGLSTTSFKDKNLYKGGIICGLVLFLASASQQVALQYSSVGKAGFITTFYIVMVPIFSLFLKKKPGKLIWLSVVLGVIGLYLLCIKDEGLKLEKSDILLFVCAMLFALQIICIDIFASQIDSVKLSCIQFATVGIVAIIPMLLERPTLSGILGGWISIAYAGVLSSGVAFTLQTITQKHIKPSVASLIMCLESVFSVLFGFLILGQTLTLKESIGCLVMFAAVILAQFDPQDKQ